MAGYTRQSIADIINGADITAPPVNAEFNQITAAFNGATGHSHDGSTGNAPKIDLTTSVSGYLPAVHGGIGGKNNFAATTNPLATDDAGDGYAPGSMWENTTTGRVFICVGNTSNAAVWRELVQVQTANKIIPETTNTVDLGDPSTRFQDLWLAGGLSAFGNGSLGGTLTVTGATTLSSTLGVTGDTTLVNLSATGTSTLTSVDVNSGAIDSTAIGNTTPAAGTFTTLNANTSLIAATADINGGTVDGATIGASTPSTGAFTDLDASGTATLATVDINAGAIDGTVIGASSHTTGKFTTLQSTGQATLATVDINGGTIDGATVGATTASSGAFTTLTASGGITGALTGNVTGNVTGSLSGGTVTGNVTGNLTGNVTAGSGSSSFNDVTISGTLNMDANSAATITNLSAPTNDNDAARKIDVDNAVANLVDSAPDSLNTLNELAAALADDDDAFNTLNTSIGTKLPKAGGTMTGAIAMSTNKITGVGDPTAAQDVSSKAYTDAQRDTRLATAGGTMSGEVAMGNNKITGLATPVASTDATNRAYVDGILGSATVAATSATTATTQAGIATTKAGEAANSASAALASEQAAAASYDNFDDRYLGAKSTAPTLDNDGDALDIGALYFNSTTNIMNVYGSGGWQSAGSAVNGTSDRNTYTATAGQTVFAATYDTGYVDVYLNGVKLISGTDFTATNGTSITLASGAAVNDVVDIVAYGTFVLADHYTSLQSDARYVEVAGDSMTGNLSFGVNDKAIFGAGSDLQIYHDGANSRILENGTGFLAIGTNGGEISLRGDNFNDFMLKAEQNSAVTLYHNNASKLATTSTGIDVSGRITTDAITEDTNGRVAIGGATVTDVNMLNIQGSSVSSNIGVTFNDTNTSKVYGIQNGGSSLKFHDYSASSTRMTLDTSGNVLVGKASPNGNTVGGEIRATGQIFATASSTTPMYIRRKGDNAGELLGFETSSGAVGGIGVASGDLYISGGSSHAGIRFDTNTLTPAVNGTQADATVDLGYNSQRFKDGYFSGTVNAAKVSVSGGHSAILLSAGSDLRATSGSWTGEHSGKIQYHNNEWYLQASTGWNFRNASAINVMNISGGGDMTVSSSVTSPNFNTTSDATLKTNVETLTGSLDAVKAMRGVTYDWIESGNSDVGVIAQEIEEVIPDLVNTNDEGIKSVKYGNIVAVLIEAIKEQQAQIDELKAQLNS